MALSKEEKESVRYHLGYLNVQPAAALQFGLPAPVQALFIVDSAMDRILPEGEDRVRQLIKVLDRIECLMIEGLDYLPANRLGDLEVRREHIDDLRKEYYDWAGRLAGQLGSPLYPYSIRFKGVEGRQVGNIDVEH